jgi:predicted secreted protein
VVTIGVAFVAHCLLNQNAKVGDAAHCAGVYTPVVDVLRDKGWRIEQIPCPELAFAGLLRWWEVREQYDTRAYRRHCRRIAEAVADMISHWVALGEPVVLIGVDGSPSMGVHVTSSDPACGGRPDPPDPHAGLVPGEGIFVEELGLALTARGLPRVPAAAETCDLPDHDITVQRMSLEALMAPEPQQMTP